MEKLIPLSSILQVFLHNERNNAASLTEGQAVSLSHDKGKVLHCDFGRLWVTFEGAPEDIILSENESIEIPDGRRVVVSGLETGGYSLAG